MKTLTSKSMEKFFGSFFEEDDLERNLFYIQGLPEDQVQCSLKLKDDLVLAGLPYFFGAFEYLGAKSFDKELFQFEGREFSKSDKSEIHFNLPFSLALTGERVALNLLQRASAVATMTSRFVKKAEGSGIAIIDTRKTTPGLRSLEKYAVRVGGGLNHRLGQTDLWMIKDNHKSFFGGLEEAYSFFKSMGGMYTPIEAEIHDLSELDVALKLGIKHVMLDNFSPDQIQEAIAMKGSHITYEVSGGVNLQNIDQYLIQGVDAISIGALTHSAVNVDISLKYKRG